MAEQADEVCILVRPNGPYRVYGPARLVDADGNAFDIPRGEWFVLCRCGHSRNKPFCDSSHKQMAFTPETYAPRLPPETYAPDCPRRPEAS